MKNVVALSTDKASSPINLYGATKLCSDKLFVSAQNIKGRNKIKFSVVRYGNVFGSRGSVVPLFLKQSNQNLPLSITDPVMTRFSITLDEATNYVLNIINRNKGGEIFVPKLPSYKILDVAKVISKNSKYKIIGIRPGEKKHEEMISEFESENVYEGKSDYVISNNNIYYKNSKKYKKLRKSFSYNSFNNFKYLNKIEIQKLIKSEKKIFEL